MFFNILFFIYSIFYFPYLILTHRFYKGYGCRLGFFPRELTNQLEGCCTVWIHAVSVGEVMAISNFISQIQTRWPTQKIVLTTTTKTGYELACSKLSAKVIVIPSPLDFTWVVSAFMRLIKPRIYIAAETEIWPNLFDCLKKNNVPIMIINGRISDVSYGRYQMIKGVLKGTLEKVWLFCMQSEIDANRIRELGAPQDKVVVLGNIKFDELPVGTQQRSILKFDRPLWIAGSTHSGEEEIVLDAFILYQKTWTLAIAPRHIERTNEIIAIVESKGLKALRYSQLIATEQCAIPTMDNTVIVIDTIGHLRFLYEQASLVFVGKSLCVGGGHNVLEPAFYAKPIVIGPLMENFRDITALFKSKQALVQVKDSQEFKIEIARLMGDEHLRRQLGERALSVVVANQGATDRILERLTVWL